MSRIVAVEVTAHFPVQSDAHLPAAERWTEEAVAALAQLPIRRGDDVTICSYQVRPEEEKTDAELRAELEFRLNAKIVTLAEVQVALDAELAERAKVGGLLQHADEMFTRNLLERLHEVGVKQYIPPGLEEDLA